MTLIVCALLLMLVLFTIGVHMAVAMAVCGALLVLFASGVPLHTIAQNAFTSVDSYALVAIPFFIWTGDLMMRGRIATVIVELIGTFARAIRGGLAVTVLLACVFFAAISGSSVATAAAVGASSVESLKNEGYPARFAAALAAVGGTLGVMIPPSLSFIVIGAVVGMPVDKLFLAGILPGLLEAFLLILTAYFVSWRRGYGIVTARPDYCSFARRLPPALPALVMPILILGSIYGGFLTP